MSLIAFFVVFTTIGSASAAPLFKDVGDSFPTRAGLSIWRKGELLQRIRLLTSDHIKKSHGWKRLK